MEKKELQRYVFFALFILLIYISYLIVKPFVSAILASFVLAYMFHPLYKRLNAKLKRNSLSAFIISVLVVILIVLPLIAIANAIIREAADAYRSGAVTTVTTYVTNLVGNNPEVNTLVSNFFARALVSISNLASQAVVTIPSKIFHFLIAIYAFFHLLIIGERVVEKLKTNLPFKNKEKLVKSLGDTTYAIVYGIFIIALVEFIIAAVGFKILGIKAALLWGLVIGIFGLIPFLGPGLVWVPMALIKGAQGEYALAIWVVILGVMLTLIDTFGRPWIIGRRIKMHPVMIVIGVIGGVALIGFIGVIIGPLLLSFVSTVISDYYQGDTKNEVEG